MSRLCHLVVCNLLVVWLLAGCSTPGSRAHAHAAALHRLSPADQHLVLHGRVRPGISQEAVYIAWGEPDAKTMGDGGKAASETWFYRQRVTIYEPINSYYYTGPSHGFGGSNPGRGFLPAYAYGGVGYEGTLRYQPHVRTLDSVRIAEFGGGKLDRYKGADGSWRVSSPARVAPSLTARSIDRRLPPTASLRAKVASTHHASLRPCAALNIKHLPSRHLVARHLHRLR